MVASSTTDMPMSLVSQMGPKPGIFVRRRHARLPIVARGRRLRRDLPQTEAGYIDAAVILPPFIQPRTLASGGRTIH